MTSLVDQKKTTDCYLLFKKKTGQLGCPTWCVLAILIWYQA